LVALAGKPCSVPAAAAFVGELERFVAETTVGTVSTGDNDAALWGSHVAEAADVNALGAPRPCTEWSSSTHQTVPG
jgi:hypothetical protein